MKLTMPVIRIRSLVDASISQAGPMQVSLAAATIISALYRGLPIDHRAAVVKDLEEWETNHTECVDGPGVEFS